MSQHSKIAVSVSGGSDSDTVLDLIELVRPFIERDCEIHYCYFDLEFEFDATKRHIGHLENKYAIKIETKKPRKSIPQSCREHGVPFLSKQVSEYIFRLQSHNFKFELNASFEELYARYPRAKSALRWWCNEWGDNSSFNISKHFMLKEFLSENPPTFKISEKCCDYAKKYPGDDFAREIDADLTIRGMRIAEGGRRATVPRTCYKPACKDNKPDYCPLWYWTDADKHTYKVWRGLRYSDCYEVYGLSRTGCFGCPFNSLCLQEIEIVKEYEPKLAIAARNVFRTSYDYVWQFTEFKKAKKGG